ncbi:hypothetical protein J7U46_19250 [Pelomonas sp. V22]|uniref:HAD domain-containing protein n=1 Tax=Pelomonas sp. V22 TaxID=2822139 RepID=UPI0024A7F3D7|nr:HAD domain-containing protein [Pelomonas sp. V22]MDI4635208.1 hypothetical protein [Pelomonas sp. V22]
MIVFLDIDGVLHPVGASVDQLLEHAQTLAAWLREQPAIQLVVSSSWRETHSIEDLKEMLFHFEPELKTRVIGVTPLMSRVLGIDFERSGECQAWLVDNGHDYTAWAALDDDKTLFDPKHVQDNLVLCEPATGLDRARLSLVVEKLRHLQLEEPQRRRFQKTNGTPMSSVQRSMLGFLPGERRYPEITEAEEAEIVAAIARSRQIELEAASAVKAAAAARRDQWLALPEEQRWATVLLDIDEVLCVGQPFAAASLHKAFADGEVPNPDILAALFSPEARAALLHVHEQLRSRIRYAISSSWREHFTRSQIELVLRETGLAFVADSLHEGKAWRCYQAAFTTDRRLDIESWIEHFHCGEPFVVVDDRNSGGPLLLHRHFHPNDVLYGRVVLCQPGVGLTMNHVDDILAALRRQT